MIQSPQSIRVARAGEQAEAAIAWRYEERGWVVELSSPAFETVVARESDAFEALCRIRRQLEPDGWRVGVAGALPGVWPSGMARDQGGGLTVYRLEPGELAPYVDTFSPVDPATVTTVALQEAEADRVWGL
ncbi:hypothetical protein [Microbacterium lacus]|uniref:Uncharacterized protein n=1 Tax=Microbacterium lacus TaxID=415217 RepID=A0ABN2H240_9MICO